MPKPGPEKALCGAQKLNRPPGETCGNVAGHGTDHLGIGRCHRHGGNTGTHRRAADAEKAKRAAASLGLRTVAAMDPAEALLDELVRTLNNVHFYEGLVAELATHPSEAKGQALYGPLPSGEAKPHVLVGLYNAERAHYTRVAAEAVRANVSVRVIELAEDQARQVASVLVEFARRLGLDPGASEVREAGRAALQLVAGGAA